MKNKRFSWLYLIIPAVFVIAAGIVFGLLLPRKENDAPGEAEDIIGCYVYDECLYMNPLSSFMPYGGMPYVYGIGGDALIIADTSSGDVQTLSA